MKTCTIFFLFAVCSFVSPVVGAQTTYSLLRLNDGGTYHKGTLEFGLSDVVFQSNPLSSVFTYGDLLIKTWSPSAVYVNTIMLKGNGNVGIGTLNPDSKLSVNGKIKCEEVQVVVDVPADYVFDLSYKLMPLSEVGKYIKANKHLPNVPSAEEIKQNGWNVAEMNNKLLEKVEELTLYLLQLKDDNEALQNANEDLKARVEALESQR